MSPKSINLELNQGWSTILKHEFTQQYYLGLIEFLSKETEFKTIFPPISEIFAAYNLVEFAQVKVVILGQDPYHGMDQGHGLSFSVKKGVRQPPSLRNIFKELHSNTNLPIPDKFMGDLSAWAKQGVLLLNSVLTVEQSKPNSHKNKGWELFTDATIQAISENKKNVVFILWGNYAKQKRSLIDETKHLVITSVHPSPFSARNGFFGSKPFSKTNSYLHQTGQKPVDWKIE